MRQLFRLLPYHQNPTLPRYTAELAHSKFKISDTKMSRLTLSSYMFRTEQSIIGLMQELTVKCSYMLNIQYIVVFTVRPHIT